MRISKLIFNLIFALTLVMAALGDPSMVARAGNNSSDPKADPRLLQLAEENPNATFMVIIQRDASKKHMKDDDPDIAVKKGGGSVRDQFGLIDGFSAELTGKEITKLAKNPKVRWISADAPMVSTARPGMETVRDQFDLTSYGGNDGTRNWKDSWSEFGESDGVGKGILGVYPNSKCANSTCLRLGDRFVNPKTVSGVGIYRDVDLKGAASAFLTFNYRRSASRGSVVIKLSASGDGGMTWTDLADYALNGSDSTQIPQFFDISRFISDKTRIRFLVSGKFAEEAGTYLYLDDIEVAFAYPSTFLPTVRADQLGLDGSGVTVAVVDSGLTTKNTDFMAGTNSRILANLYFGNKTNAKDEYGHGTHVAGIIGGNGAASGGIYRGVAPGVNLLNLRVSDKDGMTYESSLVNSLEWIYKNKDLYNIRVVNVSMNSTVAQSYHTSPLAAAVEILWFNGIVVVVSAGNNGTGTGPATIYPPANDPFVITVGATEDKGTSDLTDDRLAVFSAYGVTQDGFAKPDLVAPGRNLIAPLSEKASTVFTAHPMHRVGDHYFRMSGTSMSAPVVTGAVALLLQSEPHLNPDQVKFRLMATANPNWSGYSPDQAGAGYLDVYAAVTGATDGSANQGILPSQMLSTGDGQAAFGSVGWNSVGWNTVGWNTVGWNSVGWNASNWDD